MVYDYGIVKKSAWKRNPQIDIAQFLFCQDIVDAVYTNGYYYLPTLVVFLLFPSRGLVGLDPSTGPCMGLFSPAVPLSKLSVGWLLYTIYINIHTSICIYIMYIHMWANYNDLTATSLEWWLIVNKTNHPPNGLDSSLWNIIIYPRIYITKTGTANGSIEIKLWTYLWRGWQHLSELKLMQANSKFRNPL